MTLTKNMVKLEAGMTFTFKGMQWIILDPDHEGGVFAIMKTVWKDTPFNSAENNADWSKSTLRQDIIKNLLPILGEKNLLPHMTDMVCDNGDDRLGKVEDKVFILSCDEYRKYRKYVPLFEEWMWTCTPWYVSPDSGNAHIPRNVGDGGHIYGYNAIYSCGAVPACIFNPIIFESAPTGAAEMIEEG